MDLLEEELTRFNKKGYQIKIACSTEERVKNIRNFLERNNFESKVQTVLGALSAGMEFPEDKFVVISDADIFTQAKHRRTRMEREDARPIKAFSDIGAGDYVVHENHGIGKFIGIEQLSVQDSKKDYLKIKYGGEDMLYIPVEQMDLIQKYVGAEGAVPKVNKLSGGEWKKTKAKVKAAIEDMAEELLALSAARSMEKGFSFSPDTTWQREFEDLFPYEETKDQLRAVREIKRDMEKDTAMDRLLCGDVGYGKTEVAARAVFKCITEGKQAAILVPTTILANQHYYTFKERMENFPFEIEMLSRFRSDKQQDEIIQKMKKGSIDVVIGTHRLLSKDIGFKDLGLLIIDEEQRFGVQHKEAIKMLRKSVDVLALSATPIPRTLHMSLAGIRDMSVIEEPPEERYPIQTYVMEQEDEVVREAIYRELDRDGQVYVVFNRVIGIKRIAAKIKELVPEAKIAVAHGQMNERELEDIMFDFTHHKYNVLVATTIIESGLDIPNVNTMVIMDSDRFGLSQLYQLRGRVGRSNRIAYAYLLHQKEKVLSEPAEKRLRAIKEFTEFGSGFRIAMRDLEIRGAGNLLGTEQSGHMMMIGYELYCKLLDEAVAKLGGVVTREEGYEASMEIEVNAYIPNAYIQDEVIKLSMYKKIASINSKPDYEEVLDELMDRFGDVPLVVENLLKISYIKALSEKAGIAAIKEEKGKFVCEFNEKNSLSAQLLFKLAADYGPAILISARQKPTIKSTYKREKDKMKEIQAFVEKLLSDTY
jgi:transcription-repair coupling factor (superfamily II helicase)